VLDRKPLLGRDYLVVTRTQQEYGAVHARETALPSA
jgi:hypothetical protein